jgi:hypothetical protein
MTGVTDSGFRQELTMTHILLMQFRSRGKHAIELWMIKHNIPEESSDILQKKFQRLLPGGSSVKLKKNQDKLSLGVGRIRT